MYMYIHIHTHTVFLGGNIIRCHEAESAIAATTRGTMVLEKGLPQPSTTIQRVSRAGDYVWYPRPADKTTRRDKKTTRTLSIVFSRCGQLRAALSLKMWKLYIRGNHLSNITSFITCRTHVFSSNVANRVANLNNTYNK